MTGERRKRGIKDKNEGTGRMEIREINELR